MIIIDDVFRATGSKAEQCAQHSHSMMNWWPGPRLLTGLNEKSALVREALKALIERESARRLALLGGTEPDLKLTPRRRLDPK